MSKKTETPKANKLPRVATAKKTIIHGRQQGKTIANQLPLLTKYMKAVIGKNGESGLNFRTRESYGITEGEFMILEKIEKLIEIENV